ncbi:MAG: branched-chain amino acid transaminase [Spirochaetia bacterium]|nr:branched-chain amino acid transaminase [Spirochaetia bacterium]
MDLNSIAYHRCEFKKLSDCNVNIATHALQYGTAVFGGIRGYYSESQKNLLIFRMDRHFRRLHQSAKMMQMIPPLGEKEMANILIQVARLNNYRQNVYFRPYLYKSATQLSPRFHDVKDDFSLYSLKMDDYLDTNKGLSVCVSSWRRIDDNIIPTRGKVSGGYANSGLAKSEAVQNGYDEAIFLDTRGFVCEGSAENIFLVREGTLITPPVSASVLEGVTRRSVMEIAKSEGIPVEERDIARAELYIADEVFFTGTGAQIAWISAVDKRVIGEGNIGTITERLRKRFIASVLGEDAEFKSWVTPVYE